MNVEVYVEGGGSGKALRTRCRQAFSRFFKTAGLKGRMPGVIACGSRSDAYKRFCTAASDVGERNFPMLLVDSEQAVTKLPWGHLYDSDGWNQPQGTDDEQAQLMVECMEAWFLADVACLKSYFGEGFIVKHVQKGGNVESISKLNVFKSLKMATKNCKKCRKTKGYDKAQHSFELLGQIDPQKVRGASKHADRLLKALNNKC